MQISTSTTVGQSYTITTTFVRICACTQSSTSASVNNLICANIRNQAYDTD